MKPSRLARRRMISMTALATVTAAVWWTWPQPSAPQPAAPQAEQGFEPPAATDVAAYTPKPGPMSDSYAHAEPQEVEPVPKVQVYTVVEGDTVEGIASRFGLEPTSILWSNGLDEYSLLRIDQELLIPATDGIIHEVAEAETLWDIAGAYGTVVDDVVRANPDISPDWLKPGDQLVIPGGAPPRRSNMVASRSGSGSERDYVAPDSDPLPEPEPQQGGGAGGLIWPLSGQISEYFGWRTHPVYGTSNYHEGIDIAVPEGTPIQAIAAGKVTMAEWYGGWGLTVQIDHGNGLVSRYSHDGELLVSIGDWVEAGQVIAYSGNTGVSTGPHLDFGIYQYGEPVDPLALLP